MHDVAEFLKAHEPFSSLDGADLERLAERAQIEFFTAGTVIFKQGQQPPDEIRVLRKGAVELAEHGRVLDLLEEGEMFGQAWMFSGLPTGWEARAREDTLCYAIAAGDVLPFLGGPEGLRFVARSLLMLPRPGEPDGGAAEIDASRQPAGTLVREQPLICGPDVSVRDAARGMVESGVSSVVVELDDGELGILTDNDLRSRVVAEGLSPETAVREVITTPVVTARADEPATDVMLTMLDHGIRHVPVISASDEVLGVVTDLDLLVALHRGGLGAGQVSAVISVVVEALVRRMVELAEETAGPPPAEFAWLWLGSHGRREAAPSSDVDSGLVWEDGGDPAVGAYMRGMAEQVAGLLEATELRSDAHGVTAAGPVMAQSAGAWEAAIGRWLDDPTEESLMAISILLDGRSGDGQAAAKRILSAVRDAKRRPAMLRLLLRLALASRPPTGFLRDFVVEHSGEHRGSFDIKRGGLMPIVGIARYAGLAAGATSTSTVARLRAAGAAGVLAESEATTLAEAWGLMAELRMEHQVRELEVGTEPDDYVDPKTLDALTRNHLREAFRLVAVIQKRLGTGLAWDK